MQDAEVISIEAPEARVTLDRARTLRLNNRALIRAKQALTELRGGQEKAAMWELGVLDDEAVTALIWGCLEHEDKTLTVWQVSDWLHPGNRDQIRKLLRQLTEAAMPAGEAGERPLAEGVDPESGPSRPPSSSSGAAPASI